MPKRIQRKRTKGWRMPENAVSVARPSKWGNPWIVGSPLHWIVPESGQGPLIRATEGALVTPEIAVDQFRIWVQRVHADIIADLKGKDLACFCPLDQPCHADVLLRIANP